jgi:hypothetical protein
VTTKSKDLLPEKRILHIIMLIRGQKVILDSNLAALHNDDKMGLRYKPMSFTEQGVAMLSGVLRSKRAIQVNIQIMRAVTQLRQMLATHKCLKRKIEDMEEKYDEQFRIVFEAIKQLIETEGKTKRKIGF